MNKLSSILTVAIIGILASCGVQKKAVANAGAGTPVTDSLSVKSDNSTVVTAVENVEDKSITPPSVTAQDTAVDASSPVVAAAAPVIPDKLDTVFISNIYTTHLQFPTDIIYADLSNRMDIDAKIIENAKDVIAIQAKYPFRTTCNLTAMESNGTLRTYIIKFKASPASLLVDEKHHVYDQKPEIIKISSIYDSHMVYSTDIKHAHVSDPSCVTSMVLQQSPNILAIKARTNFGQKTSSVTILESEGYIHTYIAEYEEHPSDLIMNFQEAPLGNRQTGQVQVASRLRHNDAPILSEVINYPQGLFHIATRKDKITVVCENVFSYSDITYITLRIENNSGVSFEADRTSFVIGSKSKRKKIIVEETNLIPKASLGTLTVAPGKKEKITYSFDKITLAQTQTLRVCVYEMNGRRDFFLTLSPRDINEASRPGNSF